MYYTEKLVPLFVPCNTPSVKSSLQVLHFVWIPKRRKKVLTGNVAIRLEELLYEKTKELDCEILALEIMEDHVHLFLSCPLTLALLSNNVSFEGIYL